MSFKVSIWWYVFFILSMLADNLKTWLMLFVMLLIHEAGHIAAAKKLGYQISKLTIYPFGCGAEIEHIDHGSTFEEVIIILCGIGMHLFYPACFALMHRAGLISSAYQNYLTHLNASVMLFNLLPVYPLDGGRLLYCIMQSYGSYRKGRTMTLIVSMAVLLLAVAEMRNIGALMAFSFLFIQLLLCGLDKKKDYHDFMLYRYMYPKEREIKLHQSLELYRNYISVFQKGGKLISEREWLHQIFNQH